MTFITLCIALLLCGPTAIITWYLTSKNYDSVMRTQSIEHLNEVDASFHSAYNLGWEQGVKWRELKQKCIEQGVSTKDAGLE
jgi:hypothetical protein